MRHMTLGAAVLVVIQVAVGMVVNLYAPVPTHHPGSHTANYFSGSFHSVVWALGHGPVALVIHASLGLALVAVTLVVAARAVKLGPRSVSVTCVLGISVRRRRRVQRCQLPRLRGSEHQLVDHGPACARSSLLLLTRAVSPSGSITRRAKLSKAVRHKWAPCWWRP